MSPPEEHAQIATACLRYLSLGFLRGGVCATEFSLNVRLKEYPCARYAAQYFDYHLSILKKISEDFRVRLEAFLSQPERSIGSILQLRRLQRGSHSGLIRGEFDDVQWFANAGTLIESTGLGSIHGIGSENACWHGELMPYALHQACYGGSPHVVKRLIDSGCDPLRMDQRGNTPLFYAARGGHPEVCRILLGLPVYENGLGYRNTLRAGLDLNHESVFRVFLLGSGCQELIQSFWAVLAFEGYEHLLSRILETTTISAGADSTVFSALVQAASYKSHLGIIRMLFEKCSSGTSIPNLGSALHVCCQYGHFELAQLLLDRGATANAERCMVEVHLPDDVSKSYTPYSFPLQFAVESKQLRVAKLLLENGADVNCTPGFKDKLLLNTDVIQTFLDQEAKYRCHPLQIAVSIKDLEIVKLLLENGADINVNPGFKNEKPLNAAAIRTFLKQNAKNYYYPLQIAVSVQDFEMVKLLLENDADVNGSYGFMNKTPIRTALIYGDLKREAIYNYYPLQIAIAAADSAMVIFLLSNGADVNFGSLLENEAALNIAAEAGHIAIVKRLLDYETNLRSRSKDYWIDFALKRFEEEEKKKMSWRERGKRGEEDREGGKP